MNNYYKFLCLPPTAGLTEIQNQLKLAAQSGKVPIEILHEIRDTLYNSEKRRAYDAALRQADPAFFQPKPKAPAQAKPAAQAATFASFNSVNTQMLAYSGALMLISVPFLWRERHRLDVHLLGRNQVVNLGIHYQRHTLWILFWIALLVASATATVGVVSFFGLLVCALVNAFSGSLKHSVRLPMAFLIAAVMLVLGQTVFEHLLGMKAVLSVVIEFVGSLVFLWLVLKKNKAA